MTKAQATERNDLDAALARLPEMDDYVDRFLHRVEPHHPIAPGARVLDLGAAQGVAVTAFLRAGYDARGVEPWKPAIAVSREVARHIGIDADIRYGWGEDLPFAADSFDLVFANSVLEHVTDPALVFAEAHRVLRRGGAFFFSTSSALSPRQVEIARFPLFPWYPPVVQRAIMDWAKERRPWLIGGTSMPAYHWFRHRWVRRTLAAIGFRGLVDRWQLRHGPREQLGWRLVALRACRANRGLRLVGDVVVPGMEYLAVK